MQAVRNILFGFVVGISILFASYLVGTTNNVSMNQAAISSLHSMVRVAGQPHEILNVVAAAAY